MRLRGVKRVVFCGKTPEEARKVAAKLRPQLAAFARAWGQSCQILERRGLGRLCRGITIVFTNAQEFYARFWSDDVLCVNLVTTVRKDPVGILVHELGHRVWFRIMSPRTRGAWVADHKAHKAAKKPFATGYAQESAIEDHAEHFRLDMEKKLTGAARVRYVRLGPTCDSVRSRLRKANWRHRSRTAA